MRGHWANCTPGLTGKAATGRPDRHAVVGAGALGRSRRRRRADPGPVRGRGRRGRGAPPDADRAARCRQNDAGATASGTAAAADARARRSRSPRSTRWRACCRADTPLITRPPFVAPHHTSSVAALVGGGSGHGAAGRGQPRASRRAVPRRVRRDRGQRAGSTANAVGGRRDSAGPPRRRGALPGPVPAGAGRQPVPVRTRRSAGLHLRADGQAALPGQAVRTAAGSGGPARRRCIRCGRGRSRVEDGESTAVVRERVACARARAAERWRPHGIRTNAEVSGALLRRKFRPAGGRDGAAANGARPRPAQHPRRGPHAAGRVDAGRPGRADIARSRRGRAPR